MAKQRWFYWREDQKQSNKNKKKQHLQKSSNKSNRTQKLDEKASRFNFFMQFSLEDLQTRNPNLQKHRCQLERSILE